MGYARSPFRVFEIYLRFLVGLDEDDIQLKLKQYISYFVTYEIPPGLYSNKDLSEAVCAMIDHEGTLQIEFDDITKKTKTYFNPFSINIWYVKF